MAAGEAIVRLIQLETLAGVALSYADKTAFLAGGWALSFEDSAGAALSPQPTYTIADEGSGLHRVNIAAEPTGQWYAKITQPAAYFCDKLYLAGDGDAYSMGGLAGLLLSALGTPSAGGTRTEGAWDDWIEEDFFVESITIPLAALAKIGATDLTGVTVTAAAKQPFPTKNSGDVEEVVFTTLVTDVANRIVKISKVWDPTLALTAGVQRRDYVVDVSIALGGEQVTSNRYTVTLAWQADTR